MANKVEEFFDNICYDDEVLAAAYYLINSGCPDKDKYVDFDELLREAFMVAVRSGCYREADIEEVLKERGLMTEDGKFVIEE